MFKSRFFKAKGALVVGLGSLAAIGGLWLSHEVYVLDQLLSQSMPVKVMTGEHRSAVYIYLPNNFGDTLEGTLPWEDFVPMASTTPWKLVSMARSDNEVHHLIGLKLLASLQNLSAASCCQVAQASDWRMALGLARSRSADLRMLLPPPPLPLDLAKSDIWHDFYTLLSLLPQNDEHKCVQYATSMVLQDGYFKRNSYNVSDGWDSEESLPVKPPVLRKSSENVLGSVVLEALLRHSSVVDHRDEIVRLKGLPLLMKFYKARPISTNDGSLIAQILGNLALDSNNHHAIFQAGWITILANWSRHSSLEVSLPAVRALANLDAGNVKATFESGVYLASPQHWDNQPKILGDVVFVHGLLGGAFKTWRQKDPQVSLPLSQTYTFCWPKDWLAHDCPHLRVIIVDYETYLTEWGSPCPYEAERRTLEKRSSELLQKLHKAGVGERPTVWVAHSMGGLMVKQMLLQSQSSPDPTIRSMCENTRGIAFYSVPHNGTPLATFNFGSRYLFLPSAEVRELQKDSLRLQQLHNNFLRLAQTRCLPCLSFCESRKTTIGSLRITATFVSPESADLGLGKFHSIDTDHLYICKPSSRDSPTYSHLTEFIRHEIGHTAMEAMQHPLDVRYPQAKELEFIMGSSFV